MSFPDRPVVCVIYVKKNDDSRLEVQPFFDLRRIIN